MISQPGSPAPTSPAPVDHTMDEASSVSAVSSSSVTQRSQAVVDRLNEKIASLGERLVDDSLSVEEMTTLQAELDSRTKQLDMLLSAQRKMVKKEKAAATSAHQEKIIVPNNLPILQWTGNVFDKNKTIFSSIQDCLECFEDIVDSYRYDINTHWPRLIKIMLTSEQRSWYREHLKLNEDRPWSYAKEKLVAKYGLDDDERQAQFLRDLIAMKMDRDESVARYTDRFHKYRREAGVEDGTVMNAIFINSLLPELSQHVALAQVHLPKQQRCTIDQASTLARHLYSKVVHSKHSPQAAVASTMTVASSVSSSSSTAAKKDKKRASKDKYCKYHGHGRHTTEECRVAARGVDKDGRITKSSPGPSAVATAAAAHVNESNGQRKCFRCGFMPWSKGHKCEVNHLAIRSATLASSSSSVSGSAPVTPPTSSSGSVPVSTSAAPAAIVSSPPGGQDHVVSSSPSVSSPPIPSSSADDIVMNEVSEALDKACFD